MENGYLSASNKVDLVIIGGGCAGMAAAISARKNGIDNILILERAHDLGGVLRQCIHNGFGIHRFNRDLTGTEYAACFSNEIDRLEIPYYTDTSVINISKDHTVTAVSPHLGVIVIHAKAVILAMGCRERSRGALSIPGTRPAGIFSAGTAQRYMNLEGYKVGKKIVILGSGDIGLIMAREFVMEGCEVKAVVEIMPYSSGLIRNIQQCLIDFDIPIYYMTTVTHIEGTDRIAGVWLSQVDASRRPIPDTERLILCDTLILSVGLIPENELSLAAGIELSPNTGGAVVDDSCQTDIPGIFACGNVLHVHDLVDYVSTESETAGLNAAGFIKNGVVSCPLINVIAGPGIIGIVPQRIRQTGKAGSVTLQFRPERRFLNAGILITSNGHTLLASDRKIMTPGEMCAITLDREQVHGDIHICIIEKSS
jgi:NADPH-dependent 2,4-dienoyl-CoA reductase/sulfur reductase-like enzyme